VRAALYVQREWLSLANGVQLKTSSQTVERRVITLALCSAAIAAVNGCTVHREARLYPANDIARTDGVVIANFEAHGTGHGVVVIILPTGEHLTGEFSVVRGGTIGFGSIYGQVYGPRGAATVAGTSTSVAVPGGSPGMASAFGAGVSMECEFYNDNFSGHGMGACRSSKGALYRLQY
jgi:hypothetical protein